MTHVAEDGTVWVMEEPPGRCEFCGAVKETRPYGPNGEQVCFPCGMKDEAAMERAFGALLSGDDQPSKGGKCETCNGSRFVGEFELYGESARCPDCNRGPNQGGQR